MDYVAWSGGSLDQVFYSWLVDKYLPHHLKPLESTIKKSKLYISSKSVLNGEWIQIQGEGAVLDINKQQLFSFLKPGDESIKYTGCDQHCASERKGNGFGDKQTQIRHLIRNNNVKTDYLNLFAITILINTHLEHTTCHYSTATIIYIDIVFQILLLKHLGTHFNYLYITELDQRFRAFYSIFALKIVPIFSCFQ
jgi:hypothetical protein